MKKSSVPKFQKQFSNNNNTFFIALIAMLQHPTRHTNCGSLLCLQTDPQFGRVEALNVMPMQTAKQITATKTVRVVLAIL